MRVRERVNGPHKRFADRVHQRRRRERVPTVSTEERGDPALVLQPGDIYVEVQAVDALHLQRDVLAQDLGNASW